MERQLRSGTGWRLGWNPDAPKFCGLVGGETWAIELTSAELQDFCQLLERLVETMAQMKSELMDEEAITCEAASELLWMEVRGFPLSYTVGFILLSGRRGEGHWPATVVPELVQATQVLMVF